ncbi:MAG: glycerol kinase GlpK [bacterium]|nr:glycerol kinase GlpK [bacterium]
MTRKFILAIDQGTTGTTALIIDDKMQILAKTNVEFKQHFPKPGWVEHEPAEIWESVKIATEQTVKKANIAAKDICALGITNQRETTCLFDRQGKSVHPFIVWQCRRTTSICEDLKKKGHEKLIKQKTGLILDPYFSATKLMWLFKNIKKSKKSASKGELLFGTIDTWLLYQLTGQTIHATDATNASRTSLMNLKTCKWDKDLLEIFKIPKACLPEIKSSSEVYGYTKGLSFLPDGIPIAGMAGDQQAALFGQACFNNGEAKITFGTGSFALLNTGKNLIRSKHGLLTSVAIKIGEEVQYCLEGSAFIAGAAVQWLRDGLGIIKNASEIEALANEASSSGEVCFVPALSGLSAPYWQPHARGILCGISRDTNQAKIARAVLQGIALQNRDMVEIMKKSAGTLRGLKVDGGAAQNNLLMQMQADYLQIKCQRTEQTDSTALGACALAGLATGIFKDKKSLQKHIIIERTFTPKMSNAKLRQELVKWQKAIKRVQI